MTNAEKAKQWIKDCDFEFVLDHWHEKTLIDMLDAVRLEEAEWCWERCKARKFSEIAERITQLRAAKEKK